MSIFRNKTWNVFLLICLILTTSSLLDSSKIDKQHNQRRKKRKKTHITIQRLVCCRKENDLNSVFLSNIRISMQSFVCFVHICLLLLCSRRRRLVLQQFRKYSISHVQMFAIVHLQNFGPSKRSWAGMCSVCCWESVFIVCIRRLYNINE